MAAPKFDTNQWYQIYLGDDKNGQSLIGTSLYTASGTKGAVFMSPKNTTQPVQNWQIFPVTINDTTLYTLRSKDSGPNGFLGTQYSANEETDGQTRPGMFRGDVAGNVVYWTFGSWGDGTWFFTNTVNGTGYHMNKKNDGIMAMSPNVTAPQNGQRYNFATIASINDVRYSSVNLVGVSATSSAVSATSSAFPPSNSQISTSQTITSQTSSTTSPTPSSNAGITTSSSGLSPGAKAGIGAGVGGVVLIALIVLGLFLRKKRQQRAQNANPYELPYETPATKYEMYHEGAVKYEMPSPGIAEVPNEEQPAELPGHMPADTKR